MKDRNDPGCDCKNDCEMVHFFSTMEHKPFYEYNLDTGVEFWFNKGNKTSPPSGILANYLLDQENTFDEESAKNATKNLTDTKLLKDLASERFDKVGQLSNQKEVVLSSFFFVGNCNPQSLLRYSHHH